MKKLVDMSPDEILYELEQRMDVHLVNAELEARAEAAHKAMEGAVYKALKSTGMTVKDAEMEMRSHPDIKRSQEDLINKQINAQYTRAAVDRAKLASELWRTEQSTMRSMR